MRSYAGAAWDTRPVYNTDRTTPFAGELAVDSPNGYARRRSRVRLLRGRAPDDRGSVVARPPAAPSRRRGPRPRPAPRRPSARDDAVPAAARRRGDRDRRARL